MRIAPVFFLGVMAGLLLLSGCCGNCDETNLGIFPIKENHLDWLEVPQPQSQTHQFTSPAASTVKNFMYELTEFNYGRLFANCEQKGSCGECCDVYDSQSAFLSYVALDGDVRFSMVLENDYLNFVPEDNPETVGAYISMTMNNRLTGELFLDNPDLVSRVTLNGVDYNTVFVVAAEKSTLDTTSRNPAAFYFKKGVGIVGYELANGEVWNLR